tara:strand:- start:893 stop:1465 length:573 start_codon:yes stop_codon:yes gene_type:complete
LKKLIPVFFILVSISLSCENEEVDIERFIDIDLPEQELMSPIVLYTNGGTLKLKINADQMIRKVEEEILEFKGNVNFYFLKDNSSGSDFRLTCDIATIDNKENMIIANGKVNLTKGDTLLSTNQLIWERNLDERLIANQLLKNMDMIYSNSEILISISGDEIISPYLKTTSIFIPWEIGNVSGNLNISDE